ncbi:MAG: hypothetical protein PHP54_02325 [Clostridia bacterium]|nr:hypothetical protein [Clostridia bacterium]
MNYLETLKNITKDKNKRVENLIFLVVLLVVLLIAINFIFKKDEKSNNTSSNENIIDNSNTKNTSTQTDLENKLGTVLSQIAGVSDVSVVVTYSQDSKQNLAYNTKESEKNGEKTSEKSVAYNEDGSKKNAVIESIEMPKVEGILVVAKGASSVDLRSKIATAIATVTGIPVYKVQVFEKQG